MCPATCHMPPCHVCPCPAGKTTVISWAVKLFLDMPEHHAAAFAAASRTTVTTATTTADDGSPSTAVGATGGSKGVQQVEAERAAPEALVCAARSNVAALNIAVALVKRGLGPQDFRWVGCGL